MRCFPPALFHHHSGVWYLHASSPCAFSHLTLGPVLQLSDCLPVYPPNSGRVTGFSHWGSTVYSSSSCFHTVFTPTSSLFCNRSLQHRPTHLHIGTVSSVADFYLPAGGLCLPASPDSSPLLQPLGFLLDGLSLFYWAVLSPAHLPHSPALQNSPAVILGFRCFLTPLSIWLPLFYWLLLALSHNTTL